jgi:hypothetical protein
MQRSHDRLMQTAGRLAVVALPLLVALAVTSRGENDPGDPVSVARELSSPIPWLAVSTSVALGRGHSKTTTCRSRAQSI